MAANPVGSQGWGGIMPANPIAVGGPGDYNFGNTGNPNPSQTSGNPWSPAPPSMSSPVSGQGGGMPANPIAVSGNQGMPTVTTSPGGQSDLWNALGLPKTGQGNNKDFAKELSTIYGPAGSAIYQYLMRGGGYNSALTDQTVQAQDVAMQREAQQGWGNISSMMGAQGISPNSSVNALASSNYWGGVTAQENAMASQEYYNMWNQSQQNEAGMLQSIMQPSQQYEANKPGFMDFLNQGLQLGGSLIGGMFGMGG